MVNLTFGEQVKIILSRKGMTIKELAELIEKRTGKHMSRQNMTQRLGRDNFQEQDMRMIAEILGCSFQLSIMEQLDEMEGVQRELKFAEPVKTEEKKPEEIKEKGKEEVREELSPAERDITVGELVKMNEALEKTEPASVTQKAEKEKKAGFSAIRGYMRKTKTVKTPEEKRKADIQEPVLGEINPYTGREYQTNSVRMHPKRIGYVQVYDQEQHQWTDMTEWAFLGYQERKKLLLGKDYEPPIYLD